MIKILEGLLLMTFSIVILTILGRKKQERRIIELLNLLIIFIMLFIIAKGFLLFVLGLFSILF